jgi:inorganic pyrophosphatase
MRVAIWGLAVVLAGMTPASASPLPTAGSDTGTNGGVPTDAVRADTTCPAVAAGLQRRSPDTLAADRNLLDAAPATAGSTAVHVVVEIPAGTADKWEVAENGHVLAIERSDGRLRRIDYLPYPANYGFIPRTRLGAEAGGDGDPVDVVLLGPATPCGAVVRARILGALRLIDDGERDDKLLAVRPGSALGDVRDVDDLKDQYPGVLDILETWFLHYKGAANSSRGFVGAEAARSVVVEAARQCTGPAGC